MQCLDSGWGNDAKQKESVSASQGEMKGTPKTFLTETGGCLQEEEMSFLIRFQKGLVGASLCLYQQGKGKCSEILGQI